MFNISSSKGNTKQKYIETLFQLECQLLINVNRDARKRFTHLLLMELQMSTITLESIREKLENNTNGTTI